MVGDPTRWGGVVNAQNAQRPRTLCELYEFCVRARTDGLFDRLLQCLARREARHTAFGDIDRSARLRIAGLARFPVRRLEGAESDERHGVALLQRSGDALDERIDGARGRGLRKARVLRDLRDDV